MVEVFVAFAATGLAKGAVRETIVGKNGEKMGTTAIYWGVEIFQVIAGKTLICLPASPKADFRFILRSARGDSTQSS